MTLIVGMLAAFPLWAQTAQSNPIPPREVEFATGDGTAISFPSLAMTQCQFATRRIRVPPFLRSIPKIELGKSRYLSNFPDGIKQLTRRLTGTGS